MSNNVLIPDERIIKSIIVFRNERVILDVHLAELYQVETRSLKQAVKRNLDRFPADFMFELSEEEINEVVSQNVIPSRKYFGGAKPFVFTEAGVAMLSSVLKSERAVKMNVEIVRTFIMLRKMALNYQDIVIKLEAIESKYELRFNEIHKVLKYLIDTPANSRNPIGFKQSGKNSESA